MGARLVQAIGAEQQDPLIGESASHVVHQVERCVVGPMQVVDQDHKWALGRDPLHEACDRLEEPRTLQGRVSQWCWRSKWQVAEQLAQVGQPSHQLPQPPGGQASEERANGLQHWCVGEVSVQRVRRTIKRQKPALARESERLRRQSGLADPLLPGQQQRVTGRSGGALKRGAYTVEFN